MYMNVLPEFSFIQIFFNSEFGILGVVCLHFQNLFHHHHYSCVHNNLIVLLTVLMFAFFVGFFCGYNFGVNIVLNIFLSSLNLILVSDL